MSLIMETRNRCLLLQKINELSFAMDDTRLFLDTHTDCMEALDFYKQLAEQRCHCVKEYNKQFGPLNWYDDFNSDCWNWVDYPWPWEGECK